MIYERFFKRTVDVLLAALVLIVLSPVFLLISIGLYYANSGHPFFVQPRPGKNGRIFKLIKFKTMTDQREFDIRWIINLKFKNPSTLWGKATVERVFTLQSATLSGR